MTVAPAAWARAMAVRTGVVEPGAAGFSIRRIWLPPVSRMVFSPAMRSTRSVSRDRRSALSMVPEIDAVRAKVAKVRAYSCALPRAGRPRRQRDADRTLGAGAISASSAEPARSVVDPAASAAPTARASTPCRAPVRCGGGGELPGVQLACVLMPARKSMAVMRKSRVALEHQGLRFGDALNSTVVAKPAFGSMARAQSVG